MPIPFHREGDCALTAIHPGFSPPAHRDPAAELARVRRIAHGLVDRVIDLA